MTIFFPILAAILIIAGFAVVLWAITRRRDDQQAEQEQEQPVRNLNVPLFVFLGATLLLVITALIGWDRFSMYGILGNINSQTASNGLEIRQIQQDIVTAHGDLRNEINQNEGLIGQVQTTADLTLDKAKEIRRNQTQNYNLLRRRIDQTQGEVQSFRQDADKAVRRLVKEIQNN